MLPQYQGGGEAQVKATRRDPDQPHQAHSRLRWSDAERQRAAALPDFHLRGGGGTAAAARVKTSSMPPPPPAQRITVPSPKARLAGWTARSGP